MSIKLRRKLALVISVLIQQISKVSTSHPLALPEIDQVIIDMSRCGLKGIQVVSTVSSFPSFDIKFMEMTMEMTKVYLVSLI